MTIVRDMLKLTVPECLHLLSIEPDIANRMDLLYRLIQNNQIDQRTFRTVVSQLYVEQPGV